MFAMQIFIMSQQIKAGNNGRMIDKGAHERFYDECFLRFRWFSRYCVFFMLFYGPELEFGRNHRVITSRQLCDNLVSL
jgi:hypothetical protein